MLISLRIGVHEYGALESVFPLPIASFIIPGRSKNIAIVGVCGQLSTEKSENPFLFDTVRILTLAVSSVDSHASDHFP